MSGCDRHGPLPPVSGRWRQFTEEERLQVFEYMGLPEEVIFWPRERRFRVSFRTPLLAMVLTTLIRVGCLHFSVDIYPGSGLTAVYADLALDAI